MKGTSEPDGNCHRDVPFEYYLYTAREKYYKICTYTFCCTLNTSLRPSCYRLLRRLGSFMPLQMRCLTPVHLFQRVRNFGKRVVARKNPIVFAEQQLLYGPVANVLCLEHSQKCRKGEEVAELTLFAYIWPQVRRQTGRIPPFAAADGILIEGEDGRRYPVRLTAPKDFPQAIQSQTTGRQDGYCRVHTPQNTSMWLELGQRAQVDGLSRGL
jgi:hypothetical protein